MTVIDVGNRGWVRPDAASNWSSRLAAVDEMSFADGRSDDPVAAIAAAHLASVARVRGAVQTGVSTATWAVLALLLALWALVVLPSI